MKKTIVLSFLVLVASLAASAKVSPYINKVYEYKPAPGQFINVLPTYEGGDTEADIIRKVEAQILDTIGKNNYICLGGWGGYVVFGFDHTIVNLTGVADFEVGGNYFSGQRKTNPYTQKNPTGTFSHDTIQAGSSEPGIIYVSRDVNGNKLPDDPWYEIAGSEYPYTTFGYSITYKRPTDTTANVMGIDCNGDTVQVIHNGFHKQPYYPKWVADSSYTLTGSLMPNNIIAGTMVLLTMDYGYADNAVNGSDANAIDIDWAVDTNGNPVHLAGIDFVKVQTGVCQDGLSMGETSTEVTGARDLHPDILTGLNDIQGALHNGEKCLINGQIVIKQNDQVFTILGLPVR